MSYPEIKRSDRNLRFHPGQHNFDRIPNVEIDGKLIPMGLDILTPGTPVDAVAATGTTAMTGTNNDWDLLAVTKGTSGNVLTLSLDVEAGKYTAPVVTLSATGVNILAGNKARMSVAGTLTSDGSTPLVFETMYYDVSETITTWKDLAHLGDAPDYAVYGEPGEWSLFAFGFEMFTSTDNVASPDLVTTWTPANSATGTPVVTALRHTAAQCKTAFDATAANENFFTLTNKSGNDGTGEVNSLPTVTLTGGVDGTVAFAGQRLYDADFLYLAVTDTTATDSSGWKKTALSAL